LGKNQKKESTMCAKTLGLAIYLAVDIGYVVLSKGFYGPIMMDLNAGKPHDVPLLYAACAYACMAIGWLSFAVLKAESLQKAGWGIGSSAIIAGLLYGLTVYGVFNFTLAVMTSTWSHKAVARDLLWGITWSIGSLWVYLGLLGRK